MSAAKDKRDALMEHLDRLRGLSALLRYTLARGQDLSQLDEEVRTGCWLVASDVESAVVDMIDIVQPVAAR